MVISAHLPPPVMTESTALLAAMTHILCCSCAMYLSAAASSENAQGSMNLASNTAPVASTRPSSVLLYVCKQLSGIDLIPASVQVLGRNTELNDEIARQVLRLDLAPLFPPEPEEGGFVIAHDHTSVGAAEEVAAIRKFAIFALGIRHGTSLHGSLAESLSHPRSRSGAL